MTNSRKLRLYGRLSRYARILWLVFWCGLGASVLCIVFKIWIPESVYACVSAVALSFLVACVLEMWKKAVTPVESVVLEIFNDIEAFENEFGVDVTALSEQQVMEKIKFRFLILRGVSVRYSNDPDLLQSAVAQLGWIQGLVAPFYDLEEVCGDGGLLIEWN